MGNLVLISRMCGKFTADSDSGFYFPFGCKSIFIITVLYFIY